jgi:hypothetical protein
VQPSFELILEATGLAVDLSLAARLAAFGRPRRGGRTLVFRIERSRVLRACQEGYDVEDFLAGLLGDSGRPVPQNVAFSLRHWEEASRRVSLHRRACLLEIEPELLERLARRRSVAESLGGELAPGLFLLRPCRRGALERFFRSRELPVSVIDHQDRPGSRLPRLAPEEPEAD